MLSLFVIFVIFYCFCGCFVFLATTPVHSLIFLILTFCCFACILIFFCLDFLALVFIVLYVGAVAILFLFVVMMLNVKFAFISFNERLFLFLSLVLIIIFFFLFFSSNQLFSNLFISSFHFEKNFDLFNSIDCLGQFLYNYFLICFLIAGIILLIAILGAILLTFSFNQSRNNQLIFRQLSRSSDDLIIVAF